MSVTSKYNFPLSYWSSKCETEVFTAVKIQVEVFWVVTPWSVVAGYQRFRRWRQRGLPKRWYPTTTLHGITTQTTTTWRWRQHEPPKRRYPTTTLHGITTQTTTTWRWRQHEPPKRRYPTTTLHGITSQKTSTWRRRQHGPPKRWYPTTTLQGVTTLKTSTWVFQVSTLQQVSPQKLCMHSFFPHFSCISSRRSFPDSNS
jgi:hypothetical protein